MEDTDELVCMEVRGGNVPADVALRAPGLHLHVLSRPYHEAAGGGDVHYVSSCGTGRITRLMVADVAGHGADVDAVANTLQTLMRRFVNRIDARQFVQDMNDEFVSVTESGVFATAIVATYFAPTGRLSLINAGHPPPLLFRAETGQWTIIDDAASVGPNNLPLGVLDRTEYESIEIDLAPGDAVVCYTDSLPESRDAAGELLGYDRLLGLAQALTHGQRLGDWLAQWLAAIDAIRPGNLATDDLTAVLIRVTAGPTQGHLAARLAGVGRTLLSPFRPGPTAWPEFDVRNLGGSVLPFLSRFGRTAPGRDRPKSDAEPG